MRCKTVKLSEMSVCSRMYVLTVKHDDILLWTMIMKSVPPTNRAFAVAHK